MEIKYSATPVLSSEWPVKPPKHRPEKGTCSATAACRPGETFFSLSPGRKAVAHLSPGQTRISSPCPRLPFRHQRWSGFSLQENVKVPRTPNVTHSWIAWSALGTSVLSGDAPRKAPCEEMCV